MKLKQIVNDKDFQNARLIIYFILFIFYIYLAYFSDFKCVGCPLCGMTRAVNRLLRLDFKSAFQFNKMVWIFCIIIPLIVIDIIMILKRRFKNMKNKNSNKKIFIIIAVVIFVVIIATMFLIKNNTNKNANNESSKSNVEETQYTTLLKDVVKIGDYIEYIPNDEEFTIEKSETGYDIDQKFKTSDYTRSWRVMYNDNENGLQIISSKGVENWFVLRGKFGYNNAVDTLNSFCNHYANNKDFAISGRCLGSNPISSKDSTESEEHYSAGKLKLADENYKIDLDILNKYSLHSVGEEVILASRYKETQNSWDFYYLRYISSSGDLMNNKLDLYRIVNSNDIEQGMKLINANVSTSGEDGTNSQYIRPVITLKQDIKVKGGDGTKDNPYQLVK